MRKKILFLLPSLDMGGAEKVMVSLYNQLDLKIFNANFCAFNCGVLKSNIANQENLIILYKSRIIYGIFGLLKVCNKIQPDVIFSTHSHLNALVCLIKKLKLIKSRIIIRESNRNFIDVE